MQPRGVVGMKQAGLWKKAFIALVGPAFLSLSPVSRSRSNSSSSGGGNTAIHSSLLYPDENVPT